jgi:hypothetical protein
MQEGLNLELIREALPAISGEILDYMTGPGKGVITSMSLLKLLPEAVHYKTGGIDYWFQSMRDLGLPVSRQGKGWVIQLDHENPGNVLEQTWESEVIAGFLGNEIPVTERGSFGKSSYYELHIQTGPLPVPDTVLEVTQQDSPDANVLPTFRLLEFDRSLQKDLLFALLANNGLMSYAAIAQFVKDHPSEKKDYGYNAIYGWFDRLREKITPELRAEDRLGWGMQDPGTERDLHAELLGEWHKRIMARIDSGKVGLNYRGEVCGYEFFFPALNLGNLPTPNLVFWRQKVPANDVTAGTIDFGLKSPTLRAFEQLIRSGGYFDPESVEIAKRSDWYRAEVASEDLRLAVRGEAYKQKGEKKARSSFEHVVKNTNLILAESGLPPISEAGHGEGFTFGGDSEARTRFVNHKIDALLGKHNVEVDREIFVYRSLRGLSYNYFKNYDAYLFLIDQPLLFTEIMGKLPYQVPGTRKYMLVIDRILNRNKDDEPEFLRIFLPIWSNAYRLLARQMGQNIQIPFFTDIPTPRKAQQDQARDFIHAFRKVHPYFEPGTGEVGYDNFTLPVPRIPEGIELARLQSNPGVSLRLQHHNHRSHD